MIAAVVWLVLQGGTPTVGDTIWLSRTVAVPAGRTLRPADWHPGDPIELLGPPRVAERGDSTEIAYPVVVWRAGTHETEIPGPLLLGVGGGVDSLAPQRITLRVASVLPDVPPDSTLAPQPRAEFVPRGTRSILPALLALATAALLLTPLHWWWRRRGPAVPPGASASAKRDMPIERWADAGEPRAVAASVTAGLRAAIALSVPSAHRGLDTGALLVQLAADRPDWPLEEVSALLRLLDEARFGTEPAPEVLELAQDAGRLESRLAGGSA
jgi:hypothetical protein